MAGEEKSKLVVGMAMQGRHVSAFMVGMTAFDRVGLLTGRIDDKLLVN
jgi:hypothetical protein